MAVRLHELSKKYNISSKDLAGMLGKLGFQVKEHPFTSIGEDMIEALENHLRAVGQKAAPPEPKAAPKAPPKPEPAKPVPPRVEVKPAQKPSEARHPAPQPPARPDPKADSKPMSWDKMTPQAPVKTTAPGQVQAPRPAGHQPHPAAPLAPLQDLKLGKGPVVVFKDEKKKTGPKPPRIEEVEEVEVNQQITIIKTAPQKKETPAKKVSKKKIQKTQVKGGVHIPRKVLEEQREAEALAQITTEIQPGEGAGQEEEGEEPIPQVRIPQEVTVNELAKYLQVEGVEIIKKLLGLGVYASLNQRLESEQVQLIGREFGKAIVFAEDLIDFEEVPDSPDQLSVRPPVVTIMGHVDHGKTSLLDRIRHSRVAEGEVGGITQHIGAYQVKTPNGTISFLDTPGHEAFTAMRAQGAQVTDIAILVVAADDGVQPQTIEAIHHAQAANVPVIVAINKVDKPEANPEKVKQQLMPYNLVAEDWGGKTIMVPVSAKRGDGIDTLLEMILLQAEIMELKANFHRPGIGTIIEAKLDKGMGPMATVLVLNGRIEMGDNIICGTSYGRVKALVNDSGARVKEAGPAMPVAVLGLSDVPRVGDRLQVVENAKFARFVGMLRTKQEREDRLARENRLKLMDLFKQVTDGKVKELNIIIKADVQGSAGALKDALERLSTAEVRVNAIHTGVGAITESDVMLAAASNAVIIGFHVRPALGVDDVAAREDVEIKVFRIIYDAIDAIKLALKGMYEPEYEEEIVGRAEVRRVFKITGVGAISGSFVIEGKVVREASVRIIRDGVEVYEGKICSLKRFKDDVREVQAGYECGIGVANYNDLKEKDILELFRLKQIERVV